MVKIKIGNKKKKQQSNKLIYDEVNLESYKEIVEVKKQIQEDKQKEMNKELKRITMINKKFDEYELKFTEEEIVETYNRLNSQTEWVTMEACVFHTKFLKVMYFEMKRDNYKDNEISIIKKQEEIQPDKFDEYRKEIESNNIQNEE